MKKAIHQTNVWWKNTGRFYITKKIETKFQHRLRDYLSRGKDSFQPGSMRNVESALHMTQFLLYVAMKLDNVGFSVSKLALNVFANSLGYTFLSSIVTM